MAKKGILFLKINLLEAYIKSFWIQQFFFLNNETMIQIYTSSIKYLKLSKTELTTNKVKKQLY